MKIVLQNLTKKFPGRGRKNPGEVTAVDELTLEIPDGELVGLLGPSGCGKTTVTKLINGLIPAFSRSNPHRQREKVVLPTPLGPVMATTSPGRAEKERF